MPPIRPTRLAACLALIVAAPAFSNPPEPAETPREGGHTASGASPSSGEAPAPNHESWVGTARFGALGELAQLDAPYASTTYTAQAMADRQADGLEGALRSDPTVRSVRGWSDFRQVQLVRGFPLDADDLAFNGLPGIVPSRYVAVEAFDRIEVLRGANAALNGVGPASSGIGGSIDLTAKRALAEPVRRATLGLQDAGEAYGAIDVGQRFGRSDAWGVRVNGVRRAGDGAIDGEARRLSVAAMGVDFEGAGFRIALDVVGQDRRVDAPRPDVFPTDELPRPPEADMNFAQPWTFLDDQDAFGTIRAEADLGDRTRAWVAAGARDSESMGVRTFNSATGEGALEANSTYILEDVNARAVEAGLSTDVSTRHGAHRLALVAAHSSVGKRESRVLLDADAASGFLNAPRALSRPFLLDSGFLGLLDASGPEASNQRRSVAIADTMVLGDGQVLATVAVRHQRLDVPVFDPVFGIAIGQRSERATTPSAGVSIRRSERVSVYGNYAEALEASTWGEAQSAAPLRSRQWEIGLRYGAGSAGATVALFGIAKPEVIDVGGRLAPEGRQRNLGLEVGFFAQPARGLRLTGGFSVLEAEWVRTQDGAQDGRDVVGAPGTLANLDAEWDVPSVSGLTLEGRWTHTGSQPADAANTLEVGSWSRWDVGLRFAAAGRIPVTLRAKVENVANASYWQSIGGYRGARNLVLAPPRSLSVSATFDF